RLGHELGVLAVEQGDHRSRREGVDLLDEAERVLVVAVDDDDREIRLVAGDRLDGLAQADADLGRDVAELADLAGRDLQRFRVLIGQKDPQRLPSVVAAHQLPPLDCVSAYTGRVQSKTLAAADHPAAARSAPQHPGARIPPSAMTSPNSPTPSSTRPK